MTPPPKQRLQARSLGMKLITVGVLALAMTIPAWFVDQLAEDRSQRAEEVSRSIGSVSGGPQVFLGPVLAVPYTRSAFSGTSRTDAGVYVIFPSLGEADIVTKSEVRHRSLFRVPVYSATINFRASFDLGAAPTSLPPSTQLDWSRAEFITGASDSRGALADAKVSFAGTTQTMALSGLLSRLSLAVNDHPEASLRVFAASAGPGIRPNSRFELAATMKFSGSQKLTVLPFANTNNIRVRGDWQHPGFNGGFLPVAQTTTPSGFQAQWSIPFIARAVASQGMIGLIANLMPIAPSVAFVELADPYQSVTRSVKYALLFLGLVFSSFFVFELTSGKRVHPAQYFLVGAAQLIFYLLLLAISERIGFGAGFAIASVATVSLLSVYARWIFDSRKQGMRALAVFTLVYLLVYLLLTLEDQALLIGSVASFLLTAALMYFTRAIDWYSPDQQTAAE